MHLIYVTFQQLDNNTLKFLLFNISDVYLNNSRASPRQETKTFSVTQRVFTMTHPQILIIPFSFFHCEVGWKSPCRRALSNKNRQTLNELYSAEKVLRVGLGLILVYLQGTGFDICGSAEKINNEHTMTFSCIQNHVG